MKFAQITPANRATLSMKHGCSSTSQPISLRDQGSQDSQVVGLTDHAATHGHLKEHALMSLRLKKAKVADTVSSVLPCSVESRDFPGYQAEQSTPQPRRSTIEQACEKKAIQEGSGGHVSITGPEFLKLVCCLCLFFVIRFCFVLWRVSAILVICLFCTPVRDNNPLIWILLGSRKAQYCRVWRVY
jgi:hypothetical protein